MNVPASIFVAIITLCLPVTTALAAPFSASDCQLTQSDPICVCENVKGKHGKTFPCDDPKLGTKCTGKGGVIRKLLEGDNAANPITIACDTSETADADGDGRSDSEDNCPAVSNPPVEPGFPQSDIDGDGHGDACDICPAAFDNGVNDTDSDGAGTACDNCPTSHNPSQSDSDSDDVGDICDNCPSVSNPSQEDTDNDDIGNACDP